MQTPRQLIDRAQRIFPKLGFNDTRLDITAIEQANNNGLVVMPYENACTLQHLLTTFKERSNAVNQIAVESLEQQIARRFMNTTLDKINEDLEDQINRCEVSDQW